jgi:hypothetical protein
MSMTHPKAKMRRIQTSFLCQQGGKIVWKDPPRMTVSWTHNQRGIKLLKMQTWKFMMAGLMKNVNVLLPLNLYLSASLRISEIHQQKVLLVGMRFSWRSILMSFSQFGVQTPRGAQVWSWKWKTPSLVVFKRDYYTPVYAYGAESVPGNQRVLEWSWYYYYYPTDNLMCNQRKLDRKIALGLPPHRLWWMCYKWFSNT